jgi:hypothetical protein
MIFWRMERRKTEEWCRREGCSLRDPRTRREERVEVVQDVKGVTRLDLTIKEVKRCSLMDTDRFRRSDSLVSSVSGTSGSTTERVANGKINDDIEGFWSFAKSRLMKSYGFDPAKFPFNIEELE